MSPNQFDHPFGGSAAPTPSAEIQKFEKAKQDGQQEVRYVSPKCEEQIIIIGPPSSSPNTMETKNVSQEAWDGKGPVLLASDGNKSMPSKPTLTLTLRRSPQ